MSCRHLTVIIGILLAASSCLAQGVFLEKGTSAPFIDFGFATEEEVYLFGLSVGFSAGGVFDFGVGGVYGGDNHSSVGGFSQFAAINFLRATNAESSRFSLSFTQSVTSLGRLGTKYGNSTTDVSLGGRAVLQVGRSKTAVAPFAGFARTGLASTTRDVNVYEFGIAIVNFSHRSVIVVTPTISTGGEITSFALSFTLNLLGGGGSSSGGKWKDGEDSD